MGRTSTFLIGALVFALAAVAILIWSGNDIPGANFFAPPTAEQRLLSDMNDVVSDGGFAASFSDTDASRWQLSDGHKFERLSLDSGRSVIGRLTSSVPVNTKPPSWESQGLSIELPAAFAQQSNGKRLEVGIIARAPHSNASGVLTVVFATRQAGNSGWRNFKLGPNFEVHRILFDMPVVEGGYSAKPIVVLQADASGKGHSVELLGIYVKQVARTPNQS